VSVTWLNGADAVVGHGHTSYVSYTPQVFTPTAVLPAHLTADHEPTEFSDRANFAVDRADDIGFDIAWSGALITPTVTETPHSWGDATTAFSLAGGNDGSVWGNDSATARTAISLVERCDPIIHQLGTLGPAPRAGPARHEGGRAGLRRGGRRRPGAGRWRGFRGVPRGAGTGVPDGVLDGVRGCAQARWYGPRFRGFRAFRGAVGGNSTRTPARATVPGSRPVREQASFEGTSPTA